MGNVLKVGQLIYEWLSQFATTYRGVLPAGVKPANKYLQYSVYVDYFAQQFILPVQIYTLNTTSYAGVLEIADAIPQLLQKAVRLSAMTLARSKSKS